MGTRIWNKTRIWNTFADDQVVFHIRVYTVVSNFLEAKIKILSDENMITTNNKISYFGFNFNRKSTYGVNILTSLQNGVCIP